MIVLSVPWQAALEEAWAAYLEGSLPIGACVVDGHGAVLARGRNRLAGARIVQGVISGHDLAHAEINALLDLQATPRPECYGWTLYTTVEPCPQCAGAVTMSGVRGLHYAAADPWAGAADILTAHPYVSRKGIRVGRAPENVQRAALVLLLHAFLDDIFGSRAMNDVLDSFAALHPAEVARAHALRAAGMVHTLRARRAGLDEVMAALV